VPDTPTFEVQVIAPDDYAAMIVVDNDGRASLRSGKQGIAPSYIAEVLTRLTGRFVLSQELPLDVPEELAQALTAAGWAPPFDATDFSLSDHDWLELVSFDGKCQSEGFGYAADEYPPKFRDEALAAAIGHAPMDRLKALMAHHQEAVDAWWNRDDAVDLINAHQQ
jgi:hypothetical protein